MLKFLLITSSAAAFLSDIFAFFFCARKNQLTFLLFDDDSKSLSFYLSRFLSLSLSLVLSFLFARTTWDMCFFFFFFFPFFLAKHPQNFNLKKGIISTYPKAIYMAKKTKTQSRHISKGKKKKKPQIDQIPNNPNSNFLMISSSR